MNTKKTIISNLIAPISLGELIDKITILHIKKKYMLKDKLKNVEYELNSLQKIIDTLNLNIDQDLCFELKKCT